MTTKTSFDDPLAPGGATVLTDLSGPLSSFNTIALNDNDQPLALVGFDAGGQGILTGSSFETQIVRTGDAFLGSTITALSIREDAINNAGTVAFQATLADGRSVIALAVVPEPSTLPLLGTVTLVLVRRARR